MKKLCSILFFLIISFYTKAQVSYIYIEGFKNLNAGILLNNNKIPKPSSQYVIIPLVDSGTNIITLYSTDNTFETANFHINTTSNSAYGYKLIKGSTEIAITDIINIGKVIPPNAVSYEPSGTMLNTIKFAKESQMGNEANELEIDNIQKEKEKKKALALQKEEEKRRREELREIEKQKRLLTREEEKRRREEDYVNRLKDTNKTESTKEPQYGVIAEIKAPPVIELEKSKNLPTQDCEISTTESELNTIVEKMLKKADDEARKNYIKKKIETTCFATKQVSSLMETFDTQEGKFLLIKAVYLKVIDKENMIDLESNFTFESYKQRLRKFLGKE